MLKRFLMVVTPAVLVASSVVGTPVTMAATEQNKDVQISIFKAVHVDGEWVKEAKPIKDYDFSKYKSILEEANLKNGYELVDVNVKTVNVKTNVEIDFGSFSDFQLDNEKLFEVGSVYQFHLQGVYMLTGQNVDDDLVTSNYASTDFVLFVDTLNSGNENESNQEEIESGANEGESNSENDKDSGTDEEEVEKIEYVDVDENHWAKNDIEEATDLGIIQGDDINGERHFKPQSYVTRAQALVMVLRSLNIDYEGYDGEGFEDTKGKWYESAVAIGKDLGIAKGYTEKEFRGEELIRREHISAFLSRSYVDGFSEDKKDFKDVSENRWTFNHINTLANAEVIFGYEDNTFRPMNNTTRAQMAAMIMRTLKSKSSHINLNKYKTNESEEVVKTETIPSIYYVMGSTETTEAKSTLDLADIPEGHIIRFI